MVRRAVFAAVLSSLPAGSVEADAGQAFLEAMTRNLQMIEVDCPTALSTLPAEARRVCLGPYWSWKEFKDRWDRSVVDPRFVPVVPRDLGDWRLEGSWRVRSYLLQGAPMRVAFHRGDGSALIEIAPPTLPPPPAATAPASAPVVVDADRPDAGSTRDDSPDTPPAVIAESRVAPDYPARARSVRGEVRVVLDVLVSADGKVERVIVDECSVPGRGFEDAAVGAVRRWRFLPGTRGGVPVGATAKVSLVFVPRP